MVAVAEKRRNNGGFGCGREAAEGDGETADLVLIGFFQDSLLSDTGRLLKFGRTCREVVGLRDREDRLSICLDVGSEGTLPTFLNRSLRSVRESVDEGAAEGFRAAIEGGGAQVLVGGDGARALGVPA